MGQQHIEGYVLVYTTSSAFESENILQNLGINIKLVPTPREFSSDCGIAVWFMCEDLESIKHALNSAKIEYEIQCVKK
ncbi:DUF3343 domain-containing protein [Helicobacter turcicus]|uniref:DUF3343 domain-containing protein n=1 Tax=Helicobacter turcicus TaxID=2867412 RepID=A0ABS7JPS8_9HELI|nr:DUF3343 domain-containing protein [Helicobacter turcicus]MBX7491370.1 DUF3343 domain-containing protein [Helicobacter turcicus]MBX7546237.1 DUF3343 domain-containing protein [Helicobacter turcicus]